MTNAQDAALTETEARVGSDLVQAVQEPKMTALSTLLIVITPVGRWRRSAEE